MMGGPGQPVSKSFNAADAKFTFIKLYSFPLLLLLFTFYYLLLFALY